MITKEKLETPLMGIYTVEAKIMQEEGPSTLKDRQ